MKKNLYKSKKEEYRILVKVLDLIYPQTCGICGTLNKNSICRKCEIRLNKKALFRIEDYSKTMRNFSEHLFIFQYEGEIRKVILNYKFKDKSYIYKTFVKFLENNHKICVQIKKYDIIIPVPISKKRYKQRGYNQSVLFSKELAKVLEIEYKEDLLIKLKDNLAQSTLEQKDREDNVKDVYSVTVAEKVKGKNILLIDDIFTTGNTVNECSRVLKLAGAKKVGIFTIAKD